MKKWLSMRRITNLKYLITTFIINISLCHISIYAQSSKSDDVAWNALKESAHSIGFCVYHIEREACNAHADVKDRLEELSGPEADVYYFLLKPEWAEARLNRLAETNPSKPSDYVIIFDVDQKSVRQLFDSTRTSNSYMMFSIMNLNDKLMMNSTNGTNSRQSFKIRSNRPQAILSNTMWREFMSNRSGRLESEINVKLDGPNAARDYSEFREAFLRFIGN